MSNAIVLADEKSKLVTALTHYANVLANLTDEQVPAAFDMTDQFKELAEEARSRLRDRLLLIIQATGQTQGDKGTMSTESGGFKLTAIPTRTGVDPKKLEALLRRKGIDPAVAMDATITYKVNLAKLATVQAVTPGEVAACASDKAFRVQGDRQADNAQ